MALGLDVGAGPGFLAREMAGAVGPSGSVAGIDLSPAMLELARPRLEGLPQASLREGDALGLPFGEGEFDAAAAIRL
ncbi:MAG: methyltransferase domain-containing protein [Candidatus Rokubacteria bacterium]|nr:methyltransferase domain-containing protein [Candidatus Rokubacteria bacterium]